MFTATPSDQLKFYPITHGLICLNMMMSVVFGLSKTEVTDLRILVSTGYMRHITDV